MGWVNLYKASVLFPNKTELCIITISAFYIRSRNVCIMWCVCWMTAVLDGVERLTAEEMDERRQQNMAYEYLCHLEEAKRWERERERDIAGLYALLSAVVTPYNTLTPAHMWMWPHGDSHHSLWKRVRCMQSVLDSDAFTFHRCSTDLLLDMSSDPVLHDQSLQGDMLQLLRQRLSQHLGSSQ